VECSAPSIFISRLPVRGGCALRIMGSSYPLRVRKNKQTLKKTKSLFKNNEFQQGYSRHWSLRIVRCRFWNNLVLVFSNPEYFSKMILILYVFINNKLSGVALLDDLAPNK
jgi:hypothetical protein